ncbi:tyrosine-type recombinase/integrase [Pasteurella multocida]|uniref:tyrosine-type recombinase/integrase n=2 Tax=Pasteurella multocida TaxID=747 RepID=UPI0007EC6E9D|nr:site-specific integrase [Pasteurella multocida]MCL7822660.1 site-specific integrase [Pasteurella multocida]MDY0577162.1 site-specific integrase [Pasteurella multocida]MEB3500012.1 site-specific integrase [Pasteurella multocida]OBP35860.1 integrase [Pasteurella multocida subsp. multocida]URH97385.1 site-specific integrase [Pasteurella multocida]
MATIRKRGNSYRAEISKNGIRKSATFKTKSEANAWAVDEERKIEDLAKGIAPDIAFKDVIERYQNEVSITKKGARNEIIRLNRFLRYDITNLYIRDLRKEDFEEWIRLRLSEVAPASVRRELVTISSVLTAAINRWGYISKHPMIGVEKPKNSVERKERYSEQDIKTILETAGYCEDKPPTTLKQRVAVAMLFAIETAMRAGEIAGIKWSDVFLEKRIVHIPTTKNGYSRDVPLSQRAIALILKMKEVENGEFVFQTAPESLSTTFRVLKKECGLEHLHFHDTRREALTRLSKKVDVMTLAKISGHRDLRILQNTYYAPNMSEVANLLD